MDQTPDQQPPAVAPAQPPTRIGAPTPPAPAADNTRTLAMLCHLLAFAGYLGIPLGNILGPLIIWLVKKDQAPEVDYHGSESLNFQISLTIYLLVAFLTCLVMVGFVLVPVIGLFGVIMTIIAAVKANNGERYRYPLCIRFVKPKAALDQPAP